MVWTCELILAVHSANKLKRSQVCHASLQLVQTIIHATCKKIFGQFDLHKNYFTRKLFARKFTRQKKRIMVFGFPTKQNCMKGITSNFASSQLSLLLQIIPSFQTENIHRTKTYNVHTYTHKHTHIHTPCYEGTG